MRALAGASRRLAAPLACALALGVSPGTLHAADPVPPKPAAAAPSSPSTAKDRKPGSLDYSRDVPRLEAEARRGDVDSMELLGEIYSEGLGVARNPARACDLFERAAGLKAPQAQHNFGNCWFWGLGRPRDYAKSAIWYEAAIQQGFLPSYCALGMQYRHGLGVAEDKAKAFQLCNQGAEKNDPETLAEIGEMYLAGEGVARDPARAIDFLRRAAERNHFNAERLLGLIYFNGDGVPRDPNMARDWLMQAADGGRRDAFLPLGKLFLAASGDLKARKLVDANALPALFWLKLAAEYEPVPARRDEAQKLYDQLAPLAPQLVKQLEPELKPWRDGLGKP